MLRSTRGVGRFVVAGGAEKSGNRVVFRVIPAASAAETGLIAHRGAAARLRNNATLEWLLHDNQYNTA